MKTYEVEGTLVTIVNANDGAEAIRKVEEEHGGMLNMSAIEVEPTKDDLLSELSDLKSEIKRIEKKYNVVLDTTYVPDTFEHIPSVRMNSDVFFNMFDNSDVKERSNGIAIAGDLFSKIHNGIEYHTFLRKGDK